MPTVADIEAGLPTRDDFPIAPGDEEGSWIVTSWGPSGQERQDYFSGPDARQTAESYRAYLADRRDRRKSSSADTTGRLTSLDDLTEV